MALARLRRFVSGETNGSHFAAVLFMGPAAAVAILGLRVLHLVALTPIWLIPVILVVGQLLTTSAGIWRHEAPSRPRLHVWVALQTILVTTTIYATGWGPALAIGLVLVGQEMIAITDSASERAVLGWSLFCLAAGEAAVALHWAPSLLPISEGYGLAALVGIGIIFSNRSLRSAMAESEEAAALTERRERRFRALLHSSTDLVFTVDATNTVTYASPSCVKVLGYEPDALLGLDAGALLHEGDLSLLQSTADAFATTAGESSEFVLRVLHRDQTWRWLEGVVTNLLDDPSVQGLVVNARDVTERKARLERQVAISELGRQVLQATSLEESDAAAIGTVMRVLDARQCRVERAQDQGEMRGRRTTVVTASSQQDEPLELCVAVGDPDQPLAHITATRSTPFTTWDTAFVEAVAGVLMSATLRFNAEEAIRQQALHDSLTGLPNRTLFNDRLQHALTRHTRTSGFVAVLIADLDGFKNVNDSLGHLAGDALLRAVADRLLTHLRGFDTIARLGGDEFAILFDQLESTRPTSQLAQRVLDALVEPLQLPDRDVAIGASVGIAFTNRADAKAERLLADADAAMYQAKREGKGCYRVFEPAMHTAAVERMNLEQELRSAVRGGALTVSYQPIIETSTGRVTSFEALARWLHPTRGFVPPSSFIPLAEDSGLIVDLGRTVLVEACQRVCQWRRSFPGLELSIAVNASRLQLADANFVDLVANTLADAELPPSSLIIEITESILANEPLHVMATLNVLRGMGVRVAIDDFGTGYSSFAALADLPIDILKIDKRFVDNVVLDDQGHGFVSAMMQLAETLQLDITAEGVESVPQRDALVLLGCTHIQGYLISQPLPGDDVEAFLAVATDMGPVESRLSS